MDESELSHCAMRRHAPASVLRPRKGPRWSHGSIANSIDAFGVPKGCGTTRNMKTVFSAKILFLRIKALEFALTGIAVCTWIGTTDAQSPRIGLDLVREHCAMCHAIGKQGDSPHPSAPPLRHLGESYNLDEFEQLLERGVLIASHPDMPTFKIDRSAARAITSYLRSIQE